MTEKILIIDDDPILLNLIKKHLTTRNYAVVTATRGEEGLRLVEETRPHLVILDIMIPGINGWEICRRIRQVSTVPIIMLTALGSQTDIVRGLEAGADDVKEAEDEYEVIAAPASFESVKRAIDHQGISCTFSELTMIPTNTVRVEGKKAQQMLNLMQALEDNEDVSHVYANFDIPDDVMEALG